VGGTGTYRWQKVFPNNISGNSITMDASASQLVQFKLPNVVYCPGKTLLGYNTEIPATAAIANSAFVSSGLEPFSSIGLECQSGADLMRLQYASLYSDIAMKQAPVEEFMSRGQAEGCYPGGAAGLNIFPAPYVTTAGNVYDITAAAARALAATDDEPRYLRQSAVATTLVQSRKFEFSSLKGTIMASQRDIFLNDTCFLNIQTNPSSKVGFGSTTAADPLTGAAALATQPILSQICLWLAVQTDEHIASSVIASARAGKLKFQIPYTVAFRNPTTTANSSIQLNLTSQYGKKCKRIIHTVMGAETLNTAMDHSNWNGSKIASYQTNLDSEPLQSQIVSCLQTDSVSAASKLYIQDDYRVNRQTLKGTVLRNGASYALNWYHQDNFVSPHLPPGVSSESVDEGLDLTQPKTWSIAMTTAAVALNHYTFVEFQREVLIGPSGPVYV
jgi:hypothetical protein